MKILSLSDRIVPFIYSPEVRRRFTNVDLVVGCGDLAYSYLEYVLTVLNAPLFFVRGNHDKVVEYTQEGQRTAPHGGNNLHGKICTHKGIILAGVEGSLRYRPGKFQYTQAEMWNYVLKLVPGLLYNRMLRGRFLDIFVSHAPPAGIHDQPDLPHQGIKAFHWLISVFKPMIYFHGHVHVYNPNDITETLYRGTRVINSYGFCETNLE